MGLLNHKIINIKKEYSEKAVTIYVDYHKHKNPMTYCFQLIQELVGPYPCMVVIDSRLSYNRPELDPEEMVKQLFNKLDNMGVEYHDIMMQTEEEISLLDISIRSKQKKLITNYIIGFILSATELVKLEEISDYFNLQYYILQNKRADEMLEEFDKLQGNRKALDQLENFNLYQDKFFQRLRIRQSLEKCKELENLLQQYSQ